MKIICTSASGNSITIQYAFPFFYVSCEGLMTYTNNIITAKPYIPGEIYQGSHNPKRPMELVFAVKHKDYWALRETVYSVFGEKGLFQWYPDVGNWRSIEYYVENIQCSDPNSQGFRQFNISLVCPFPFFSGVQTTVQMSYWRKNIMLPFVMQSPFTIGTRIMEQIKNIPNPQPINIGLLITFTARNGVVTNPSFQNLTTGESFTLNVNIPAGNSVQVDTINGQKSASLVDEPQAQNIWNYEQNDWIQLHPGDNVMRYDASSGLEYLDVMIQYQQLYLGG